MLIFCYVKFSFWDYLEQGKKAYVVTKLSNVMCPSYATLQTLQIFRPLKMAFYAVRNHHGLMFTVHFVDFQLRWDTKHNFAQTYKSVIIASSQFCRVLILSGPNPSGMAQLYHNHFFGSQVRKMSYLKN